ncbi:MAG: hypothetical protein N3D20_00770 [Candidatus Pacearchaeota archaeon]|nr:hypothetical protein [Candidatus Pacearchaeota archaeon]
MMAEINCYELPTINIVADSIGEAVHRAIIGCYDLGCRVQTPKHRDGMPLGCDAHMTIKVRNPCTEPLVHTRGLVEDARGIVQYILEVTHGIHNHWKKDPKNPNDLRWGYTYNERFEKQIPFVFAKIRNDFKKKGRVSGRDYFFSIWRADEDSILEQEDPPCWQSGQLRFLEDENKNLWLNFVTYWRSRDLVKAWNENVVAMNRLHKLFAAKSSSILGREVKVGSYIDCSASLHIYGAYLADGFGNHIERMKHGKIEDYTMSLEDFIGDENYWKSVIAAQLDYERKTGIKNASEQVLRENSYDLGSFKYPKEWDSWPKSWDLEPNREVL